MVCVCVCESVCACMRACSKLADERAHMYDEEFKHGEPVVGLFAVHVVAWVWSVSVDNTNYSK